MQQRRSPVEKTMPFRDQILEAAQAMLTNKGRSASEVTDAILRQDLVPEYTATHTRDQLRTRVG